MTPQKLQNDEMFILRAYSFPGATCPSKRTSNSPSRVPMRKYAGFILLFVPCTFVTALAGSMPAATAPRESELYVGWLKMYDLQFDEAHRVFAAWKQSHLEVDVFATAVAEGICAPFQVYACHARQMGGYDESAIGLGLALPRCCAG